MNMKRNTVSAFILSFFLLQGQYAFADDANIRGNTVIWESMSPKEKERVIQNYRGWKSSTPERRERIRRNYRQFHELSPEDQQVLKKRYREYKSLAPADRARVKRRVDRIDALPADNMADAKKRYAREREMPRRERMLHLKQSRFWENLSEEEKEIYKKLLFTDN